MTILSPDAALFIAVQAHIKAKVPALRYIDQDYGQLEEDHPPVSWPCVLIDIDDKVPSDMGELAQVVLGDVIIRIGFPAYSCSSNLVPRKTRHLAIGYYNLEWEINNCLHGWSPDLKDTGDWDPDDYSEEDFLVMEKSGFEFGALTRIGAGLEKNGLPWRVRQIRYRVEYEDYSAAIKVKRAAGTVRFRA